MTKNLHIQPLYRVNITFARKVGVYRVTFLIGQCLAPNEAVIRMGIFATSDNLGVLRFYSDRWDEITKVTHHWMKKNKGIK